MRIDIAIQYLPDFLFRSNWLNLLLLHDTIENFKDFAEKRDQLSSDGYSALHIAARYDKLEVVDFLLDNNAPIDQKDEEDKNTPLLLAIMWVINSTYYLFFFLVFFGLANLSTNFNGFFYQNYWIPL